MKNELWRKFVRYFLWGCVGGLVWWVVKQFIDISIMQELGLGVLVFTVLVGRELWNNAWGQKVRADWETTVAEAKAQRAAAKAKSAEEKAIRQAERKEERARREVAREQERRRREVEWGRAEAARKQEQEKEREKRLEERRRREAVVSELAEIASTSFLVKSCPSCYENMMSLLSVSPNGRSIQYECRTCNKRQRAAAASPRAQEAVGLIKDFARYYPDKLAGFTTPLDPLPYEQTVREPIPDAVRSQVWRRDEGECVKCGRKENLQLDHIIPVKKGGATTVNNLQLLCRSCNLAKGTKI